jgi:two-component system chemotaxis response regulator CheB
MNSGIVVLGASAGGLSVILTLLGKLPKNFPWPVCVVQHISQNGDDFLAHILSQRCLLPAVVANSFMVLQPSKIYIAPYNYHLLIENNTTLTLSVESKVKYCRPAIDPLFKSAAQVFKNRTIAVVLSGANDDGADGSFCVSQYGGKVFVQDPQQAEFPVMPLASIAKCPNCHVGTIADITKNILENIYA